MRTMPLQFLTWGTITAAVGSAVWLSSTDQGAVFCSVGYRATSRAIGIEIPLPTEPTRAGPSAKPGRAPPSSCRPTRACRPAPSGRSRGAPLSVAELLNSNSINPASFRSALPENPAERRQRCRRPPAAAAARQRISDESDRSRRRHHRRRHRLVPARGRPRGHGRRPPARRRARDELRQRRADLGVLCEPWANAGAPLKVAKWMLQEDSPLLFRLRLDPHQWRWALGFLRSATTRRSRATSQQIVALGRYSHESLKRVVGARPASSTTASSAASCTSSRRPADYEAGVKAAALMREHGVDRRVLGPRRGAADRAGAEGLRRPHPRRHATRRATNRATPASSRRSWRRAARRAARSSCYEHRVVGIEPGRRGSPACACATAPRCATRRSRPTSSCCAWARSRAAARQLGIWLNIYPAKGYSATLPVNRRQAASVVLLDDEYKLVFSRLGDRLRIAGTAELDGYDTRIERTWRALRGDGAPLPAAVPRRGRRQRSPISGPACARARPTTCPTSAAARSTTCGSTPATARWAGRTAPARAARWRS